MLPLAVEVGLKVPHADTGVQLQFTPAAAVSFWIVAATLPVPPVPRNAGGIVDSVTERGCGPGPGPGPGPGELPPPQPEIVATMLMARRESFLFMASLQKWQTFFRGRYWN